MNRPAGLQGDQTIQSDPYKVDFQALRTLKLVYLHRSFSEVANRLGVSQSVVSYTIDKLRTAFKDSLFIRQGAGVAPTARCIQAVAEADRILGLFEGLITPEDVDPARIRHQFTISGNYYERRLILPLVARALRSAAPLAELVALQAQTRGPKQLISGEADVLIGPMLPDAEGFYKRTLLTESYVCIMDPGNALAQRPLTLEDYGTANHVGIDYGRGWSSSYVTKLQSMGFDLRPAITVPSPADIADLIVNTDLIASVPEKAARSMQPALHIAPCPFPAPFEIAMVWTARTHESRLHQWFRNLIAKAVKDDLNTR
ncbi:LysR family transcriptional regulator [Roseinatronobacter alkalisoli]|uniref:LysR family transcriptional regulator n=1 Tax=Roseinatronobacter alkalisoli TaxID=3028235 RepID=A0ABT5TC37_9RHOB|nr:LysR family transcriptional regulator [Roseinatronobacter sp. HJB301]MDD7972689.1 LysR family transcriptional regulator [Roseinatronobacter sp. HJB301]